MKSYLPDKDKDLQAWLTNFISIAQDNLAALGIAPADIAALSLASQGFKDGLTSIDNGKAQLSGVVRDKDTARGAAKSDVRGLVTRIQAKSGVSDGLKAQLGITVKSGVINRTPPVQPADLVATPLADGTNTLKWHKMGNKASTQFVVLAKPLTNGMTATSDTGWAMVGQTTRAAFAHQGVTPGVPMAYKVLAARGGFASPPSLPATVYAG